MSQELVIGVHLVFIASVFGVLIKNLFKKYKEKTVCKSKDEVKFCINKEDLYKEKLDDLYCILEKRIGVITERASNVRTLNSCNFNYKLFKKYQSELFFLEFLQERIKEIIK